MIRTVTVFSVLLLSYVGYAQDPDIRRILSLPPQRIAQIEPQSEANTLIISSSFSEASLQKMKSPPDGDLASVYYIYTSYRQSASFDQKQLNKKRIERLANFFPDAINNPVVQWKIIEQTSCKSPEMGTSFFHGFVLVYRPKTTEQDRAKEIANLEAFLKNPTEGFSTSNDPFASSFEQQVELEKTKGSANPNSSSSSGLEGSSSGLEGTSSGFEGTSSGFEMNLSSPANHPDGNFALYQYFKGNFPTGGEIATKREDFWVPFTFDVDEKGVISNLEIKNEKPHVQKIIRELMNEMPKWTPAKENGASVKSKVNLELRISYSPHVRGMYYRDGKKPNFSQAEAADHALKTAREDQQIAERIERIEQGGVYKGVTSAIKKERVALVMDVTTSMSKFLAEMNWSLDQSPDSLNIVHYTFFNDGDNTPNNKKKAGKTGGIYHGRKLRDLSATLLTAMRNGNGGDVTENDFEAVLAAQNEAPEADAILLIVDNFSDVRDESLISQITKKVHVVIGGEVTYVRTCYLNLAKVTGGDIFVDGRRIVLSKLAPGERIRIGMSQYSYDGIKFQPI